MQKESNDGIGVQGPSFLNLSSLLELALSSFPLLLSSNRKSLALPRHVVWALPIFISFLVKYDKISTKITAMFSLEVSMMIYISMSLPPLCKHQCFFLYQHLASYMPSFHI